jgi:hypothetical protein
MTSLVMGQLWTTIVPPDEAIIRRTAVPVDVDKPAAVADDMPIMGEVETDHDPTLPAFSSRQVASAWHPAMQGPPAWADQVANQAQHNLTIDRQVSTAGVSPPKEASGEWGHGTMAYAVGIEPVGDLGDQSKLGNDYFTRNPRNIQDTASLDQLTTDPGKDVTTAAAGKENARAASQAALYNQFWNGGLK